MHFEARARIAQLQTANPRTLNVIGVIPNGTREDEKRLHHELRRYRVRGEWFDYTERRVQAVVRRELRASSNNFTFSGTGCILIVLLAAAFLFCCGGFPSFLGNAVKRDGSQQLLTETEKDRALAKKAVAEKEAAENAADERENAEKAAAEKAAAEKAAAEKAAAERDKVERAASKLKSLEEKIAILKTKYITVSEDNIREWRSDNGEYVVRASLVAPSSITDVDDKIQLKIETSGKVVLVELAKLCEQDRLYVKGVIAIHTNAKDQLRQYEGELMRFRSSREGQ